MRPLAGTDGGEGTATGLRAGWAVRSKPPGSYHDYEITGYGGLDLTSADYSTILRHYSLGTPPPQRTGPAALPWITLSEVRGPDGAARIGVAVEDWTGHADGAGRPIAETRYLCVPYAQLSRTPTSYLSLYRQLTALDLASSGGELSLAAPPLDPAAQAAALGRIGVARAAAAAGLLLEGPVTVTGALDLAVQERLEFLDTVAALLPYGWRARFSGATWDQSGNRNVSLAFARQVRARTAELDWREPRLPPEGTAGARYARMLADLFGERRRTHEDVIAHLGGALESCASAPPDTAVRILGALDWPVTVLRAVERGEPDLDQVRELLSGGRFRELPPSGRAAALCALVRARDTGDVPLLRACWAEAAGTARSPLRELRGAARRLLWAEEPGGEPERYCELAIDIGHGDALLAELAGPVRRGEDGGGAERAGRLVHAVVDPAGPAWPATFAALGRSPAVACALLTAAAAGPRWRRWIAALDRHLPPPLLGPFADVLTGSGRPVDARRVQALSEQDPACVPALLAAAAARGGPGPVLNGLVGWLTGGQRPSGKERTALCERLAALRPPSPEERGLFDGLLLWLGSPPCHVLAVAAAGMPDYLAGFLPLWRRKAPEGRADRRAETLAEWLREGRWAASRGNLDPVVLLVEELTADLPAVGYPLARAMVAVRAHVPSLLDHPRYRSWWRRAAAQCPKLDKESAMTVLAELAHDASPAKVGRLCADELWRGRSADGVAAMLVRSRLVLTGDALVTILRETRASLASRGFPTPGKSTVQLASALMRTDSPPVPQGLRRRVPDVAMAEIEFWLRMIETTAVVGEESLLTEESRGLLKRLADWAHDLAKRPRRGLFGGRR